jgi:ribonucleoside-diphosphate reductase alpha chain
MLKARVQAKVFSYAAQQRAAELAAMATLEEVGCDFAEAMAQLAADNRVTEEVALAAREWEYEIHHSRDAELGFMGIDTLRSKYLLRSNAGALLETPQYLFMRVSMAKHPEDRARALRSYELMSKGYFTHATPTMMNAGTPGGSLASCYLMHIGDSLDSIFEGVTECAHLSKGGGGIGLDITSVRARGSHIQSSNGTSNGITPMLNVFGSTMEYVDQGGGKRRGVAAVYMEPWHADVQDFIRLRDPRTMQTHSLFNAIWINDVFMQRVRDDGEWSLFDPKVVPHFIPLHGDRFTAAYEAAERDGLAHTVMKARALYGEIITMQLRSGTPYMHAKHACNRSSNHAHLGTINSSNLCGEIMQYCDPTETATCNLASINVGAFATNGAYDFKALRDTVYFVVGELERVMDMMHYRSTRSEVSNNRHRPMGIGMQGLADAFAMYGVPFDSTQAMELNTRIAESMYYAALDASIAIAQEKGPHHSYPGSPLSKGILHFDHYDCTTQLDWAPIRQRLAQHGARNSVLIALMPTASTSRILGSNECFTPYTRMLYVRRTLMGEYLVSSKHFLRAVHAEIGDDERAWAQLADALSEHDGRARLVESLPDHIKKLFPTTWDIKRKHALDMSIARAPFVDQAESMSIYVDLTDEKRSARDSICKQHMYAWKHGLKTMSYYTHQNTKQKARIGPKPSECLMCSS